MTTPPPDLSDAGALGKAQRRRNWRDILFIATICLMLIAPWLIDQVAGRIHPAAIVPIPEPPLILPVAARPPANPIDQLAFASARQGLREILNMRDSSAPPPVFDLTQVRIDHPAGDIWVVTGIVNTAWQMLMGAPHLYTVEVYRICHLASIDCFKTRGVTIDSEVIQPAGQKNSATPPR